MLPVPSVENLVYNVTKFTYDNLVYIVTKEHSQYNALRLSTYMHEMRMAAHILLVASLVSMLVGPRSMCNGRIVLNESSCRSNSLLDSMITDHIQCGNAHHALSLYQAMQENIPELSEHTFVVLLKACASLIDIKIACQIHADIARIGLLERNLFVGNTLIDVYVKCGFLGKAEEVFYSLPVRDVVTWTALIGGYAELDHNDGAFMSFKQMQLEGISPNSVTFICILKACGGIGAADKGREIHVMIAGNGMLKEDLVVGNALLDMYAKCGLLGKVQEIFDNFLVRNVVSWNSLISGFSQHKNGEDALCCFEQMKMEGFFPNAVTFLCSLNACGYIGATHKGTQIHAVVITQGLLESDLVLGNALVDMYAKCGVVSKAQEVFDLLSVRDVVTWTALIAGYAQHEHGEESLFLLEKMQSEGVIPNAVTFACSLKACSSIGATEKAKEIHCEIARKGLLRRDIVVGNALVDMYAKCGLLAKAQEVFDKLHVRDVVSWNSLITVYVQHEEDKEALCCYEQMQLDRVPPNALTFVSILNGCGNLGAADQGKEVHEEIGKRGLLNGELMVSTALVDMYAKCGLVSKAQEVLDELPVRDSISWNSLITGYAQLGEVENVTCAVNRMITEGNKPDFITFLSVLNCCSHAGLVDEGEMYFKAMRKYFGIAPCIEHYICILDLHSRAGQLDKAMEMMMRLPFHPNSVMLLIVLGACRKWGNMELGLRAFEQAMQVDEREAAAYLCLFNIYADADIQEDV